MKIFYWVMGVLIVGTFLPSVLFLLLHLITGSHEHGRRASALWNVSRVLVLLGLNILIWGHVVVGVWSLIRS